MIGESKKTFLQFHNNELQENSLLKKEARRRDGLFPGAETSSG
jgi:hypothetical protein